VPASAGSPPASQRREILEVQDAEARAKAAQAAAAAKQAE
jgi:hypothetical protein